MMEADGWVVASVFPDEVCAGRDGVREDFFDGKFKI